VRGSCYSVATEPQHWSSINGGSQKVQARWLEDRKKRWSGSQVGRPQGSGSQVVFAQISRSRNEEIGAQVLAWPSPEEERVEVLGPQVFGEEVGAEVQLAQAFDFAQEERASWPQGSHEGGEQNRKARKVRSEARFPRREWRRRTG
jgi:hypothetical protein